MSIGRKISILLVLMLAAALLLGALLCFMPSATAEKVAPVLLSADTVFAVSPTHLAYTSGSSLSVVDLSYNKDPFTLPNAFDGTAADIAITSDKIAVLSYSANDTRILTTFSYDKDSGVIESGSTALPNGFSQEALNDSIMLGVFDNAFIIVARTRIFNTASAAFTYSALTENPDNAVYYDSMTGFCLLSGDSFGDNDLLFAKGETLYRYSVGGSGYDTPIDPNGVLDMPSSSYGMAKFKDTILISVENGVGRYDVEENSFSLLPGISYSSAIEVQGDHLYAFDKASLAIKRYTVSESGFTYNKCYDAEEYLAPQTHDIVLPLQAADGGEVVLYRSPRDLEITARAQGGVIALTRVEYDDGANKYAYYYCVTQAGEYGYVPESAGTLAQLSPLSYSAAQPLHAAAQTPVYALPFEQSGVIALLSADENGSVLLKKSADGEALHVLLSAAGTLSAGGNTWCKVYMAAGEEVLTGYADARLISPYTAFSPAGVNDFCRTNAGRAGVYVSLYSQPDEKAEVVAELPDNTELMLVSAYDENSLWTCVYYEDSVAYVLTENITVNTLTAVQITLIVVLCVLAVLGVTLAVVIGIKRKKKREQNEET